MSQKFVAKIKPVLYFPSIVWKFLANTEHAMCKLWRGWVTYTHFTYFRE